MLSGRVKLSGVLFYRLWVVESFDFFIPSTHTIDPCLPWSSAAAHEADSQRSTRDDRRSRVVPLNPQVSALQSPLSAFKSPISSINPPVSDLKYQSSLPQLSSLSPQVPVLRFQSSPFSLHPSSLSPQVSTLIPQLSVPLPHSVQIRLNKAFLPRMQRPVFATKTSVLCRPAARFDRLTNGVSVPVSR